MIPKQLLSFERLVLQFNQFIGTSRAFFIGVVFFVGWVFSFVLSGQWHASIVELVAMLSFLNIFFVQRGQNKDLKALHLKLDELIASSNRANNSLIKAEEAPEQVLEQVHNIYKDLAKHASEENLRVSITSELVEQAMETVHSSLETTIIQEQ
jgi:low affinity Fe/Cu permease